MRNAAAFRALAVTVEHRFYGDSQPFGDLSVDSLACVRGRVVRSRMRGRIHKCIREWWRRYLSSAQARAPSTRFCVARHID